jgi:hypothetical protein
MVSLSGVASVSGGRTSHSGASYCNNTPLVGRPSVVIMLGDVVVGILLPISSSHLTCFPQSFGTDTAYDS